MSSEYTLRNDGTFIIKNYHTKNPFSNFLPGIAGTWGVPIWVFYVNRGQGVISFGIDDKEHAIVEFFPADKAYALASRLGFRTFYDIDATGAYEPFGDATAANRVMEISASHMTIQERSTQHHIDSHVTYYTLPQCPLGCLIRKLTITNTGAKKISLRIADGLPRVVPFGENNYFLKHMSRTIEAWARASITNHTAEFRLIVDPADSSETKFVTGANFYRSFWEDGTTKKYPDLIVDPACLFGHDTSFARPEPFFSGTLNANAQIFCGKTPCAFSYAQWELLAGQSKTLYSVIGTAYTTADIASFTRLLSAAFLSKKFQENESLIHGIKSNAWCLSAKPEFDQYIASSYLDNVLRGGMPLQLGTNHYYAYSRKHGDLERDYNNFRLLPSFFSEGEANYRDINQNRRMDAFFEPRVERRNLTYFLNLLGLDGYNPLIVKGEKLCLKPAQAKKFLTEHAVVSAQALKLLVHGCYLGEFFKALSDEKITPSNKHILACGLVKIAQRKPQAGFGEGYWIDHWTYNLDLIDSYLYFYPDKALQLYASTGYYFWDSDHYVTMRHLRYHAHKGKLYQWHSVACCTAKKAALAKRGHTCVIDAKGKIYQATFVEKLLSLILNKAATLDPDGIGIEMEADKPGWCDSLNGLPALFGSSLNESFELKRACLMLARGLKRMLDAGTQTTRVAKEIYVFLSGMETALHQWSSSNAANKNLVWWHTTGTIKETFRAAVFQKINGARVELHLNRIIVFAANMAAKISVGVEAARAKGALYPTYFIYTPTGYKKYKNGYMPKGFTRTTLPYFLEGPMHALRVEGSPEIYAAIKKSALYDRTLGMYKLNASLETAPLEIGRSRIFTPGWLENESIWLHMEYKYLLEILKNGMYREFFEDFKKCGVCFFDPQRYGRNILENSSFIVSSAYPDASLWGKGFVARLSGATAELLHIWVLMVLGKKPFSANASGNVSMHLSPILPAEYFTTTTHTVKLNNTKIDIEKNTFAFKLFSKILVVYHNRQRVDTFSSGCRVTRIEITIGNKKITVAGDSIPEPLSSAIRAGTAQRIDAYLEA